MATLEEQAAAETNRPVPWQCWDIPGFKECHEEAGHKAYRVLVEEKGLAPSDPLYKEFYPLFQRNFVFDCQRQYACTYSTLELMRRQAEKHQGQAFEQASTREWVKWVALAGALGVGFWWYRKR
jgi:hypothetical protein